MRILARVVTGVTFLFLIAGCGDKKQMDITDPCVQACLDDPANSAGRPLLDSFIVCMEDACGDLDTEATPMCMALHTSHAEATATCKAETAACFSGPIAGCRELAEHVETVCTPSTLPAGDMEIFGAIFCILGEGGKGMPSAQALAWPLFQCVFPLDENATGCVEECKAGGAACRTCAASKCGTLYDACQADTAGAPSTTEPPPDKAACQALWGCTMECGG